MKFHTVSISLLAAFTVTARLFSSSPQDSWDILDFKEYLSDNNINFDPNAKLGELKKLSRKQWEQQYNSVAKPAPWYSPYSIKQQLLNTYTGGPTKTIDEDWYDYSFSDVKEWVFSTWSSRDLRDLLDRANVKHSSRASHSQLVQLARDNYDSIAKANNASGQYPGGWLYNNWTEKSLKNWLDGYGIAYTSSDTKEQLSRKVRQYAYDAAKYSEDQRQSIIETLGLTDKSLFDKAGELKDDIFNTWSSSQLYNWLTSHKVEVTQSARSNQKELTALANKYKSDLKTDVDSWVKKSSKKSSPVLSKLSSKKSDNVVNDTFFVGIEKWSRDRLKSFLTSRGVAIPLFATTHHLVKLVKENKFTPIKTFNNNDFFQGWSKKNLMRWAGAGESETESDLTNDFMDKAGDNYKNFVSNFEFYANQLVNKVSDVASDAASQVSEKTAEAYAYAAKKGSEKGAEAYAYVAKKGSEKGTEAYDYAAKKGSEMYTEASKYGNIIYEEGSKQAAKAYEEGSKQAVKAYDEGSKQAAKAYDEGSKQAANAYKEASKQGSKAAADAYAEASKQGAKAAAGASKKGAELYAQATKKSIEAKDSFFDYWSDVELKAYLKSFGIYDTKGYNRNDLLNSVKRNTRWFVSGSKYDSSPSKYGLSNVRYHSANLLNAAVYKFKNSYNYVYYTFF